jgi:hypothetical protein
MSKLLGIAAVLATALGGWLYEETHPRGCAAGIDQLAQAYRHRAGGFGPGEMMSGLKTVESYCEAGDRGMAERALNDLTSRCRSVGGCT